MLAVLLVAILRDLVEVLGMVTLKIVVGVLVLLILGVRVVN
jgi:hypothetical protein